MTELDIASFIPFRSTEGIGYKKRKKKRKKSHLKACTELLLGTGWDTDTAWEHVQNSLQHSCCCSQRFSNVSQQFSCPGLSVTVTLKLNPAAKYSVGTAD